MADDAVLRAKVVFIGDASVGKTSLLNALLLRSFQLTYIPTLGPAFEQLQFAHRGRTIQLQMWDTAGQETYRSITQMYFRDAAIVLLCYDVTSRGSFASIDDWKAFVGRQVPECQIFLVGTKRDLAGAESIALAELRAKAEDGEHPCVETSALTGEGVGALREMLANAVLRAVARAPDLRPRPIRLDARLQGGCC